LKEVFFKKKINLEILDFIEICFGDLNNHFQILHKIYKGDKRKYDGILKNCLALHNIHRFDPETSEDENRNNFFSTTFINRLLSNRYHINEFDEPVEEVI
jgi:hypothetical protein